MFLFSLCSSALQLVYDAQQFAERLFGLLKRSNEAFDIRMLVRALALAPAVPFVWFSVFLCAAVPSSLRVPQQLTLLLSCWHC